ncbi:MAG TPA: pyruvate, phosphate dikinase [Candidatus Limnocylindria bacterium]|nr:pyruvate, phosphate dikinase [Candidatus Limnocylindria bacterium]
MTLVYPLDATFDRPADEVLELVGGKAANLGVMARELGLPVPAGFVITTEACRSYLAGGWPDGLDEELRAAMDAVESRVGRGFGAASDPLLVSVRSGAPVSMPGMMDTILDLGICAGTEPGLAAVGGAAFAAECRARLETMFRDIVGRDVPEDPWAQLRLAVEAVFRSWNSPRAVTYRARERIADDLGTAVTVQAMVFGNRDERSGTGVLFTRNPATGEASPYGDVLFAAQGEDVVAGTHRTEPIAVLDARLPEVASELRACAERLEHHYRDLCDIEFTIESGRLYLLQVRVGKRSPEAALRMAVEMADDPGFPLSREDAVRRVAALLDPPPTVVHRADDVARPITVGLPASPGVATGRIATSAEEAEQRADAGEDVILVRSETSPADVHGMARAAGILTARGGLASHAAVVARGWAIPAVVGASALEVDATGLAVAGRRFASGDRITIDGGTGDVFEGSVETRSVVAPHAATLLAWAEALGVALGAPDAAAEPQPAEPPTPPEPRSAPGGPLDLRAACLHALGIKGFATLEGLGHAIGAHEASVGSVADALVEAGLAAAPGGLYRLSEAGREVHADLVAAEREAVGSDRAADWLDDFLDLDRRMKEVVTAWQLRPVAGGEPVLNDHSDAAYDAAVLARLADVARDSDAWLAATEAASPRLGRYRGRLAAAAAAAAGGDHRFVASPRVDSFHGVWFELHEDLILLAGRTRADEVAAGRA